MTKFKSIMLFILLPFLFTQEKSPNKRPPRPTTMETLDKLGLDPKDGPIKKNEIDTSIGSIVAKLDSKIWVIFQDQNNNYWFGSNGNGVFFYDHKVLQQFTDKDGLTSNQIRGIQQDKDGNIYFDTPHGVTKFDGRSFAKLIPKYSALNKWNLKSNDLWFKGNGNINGVYRYDGKSMFHLSFPETDLEDKVIKNENSSFSRYGVYSTYKDTNGHMWFGTLSAGVYRYDGESLSRIYEKELLTHDDGRSHWCPHYY